MVYIDVLRDEIRWNHLEGSRTPPASNTVAYCKLDRARTPPVPGHDTVSSTPIHGMNACNYTSYGTIHGVNTHNVRRDKVYIHVMLDEIR